MKSGEINSSSATAQNKDIEVEEQKQNSKPVKEVPATPKRSTVPKQRNTVQPPVQDIEDIDNIFKLEAREVYSQLTEGLSNAWNDKGEEEVPEFDAKDMIKILIFPTILIIIYYIFPIDIVPDAIPVVGTMDDFAIAYILMITGFKKKYKKLTGQDITVRQILSGRWILINFFEHMATSTLQAVSLPVGDILILPTICAIIDCVVTLFVFYKSAFRNHPELTKELFNKQKSKSKKSKKKKLLKGDALK